MSQTCTGFSDVVVPLTFSRLEDSKHWDFGNKNNDHKGFEHGTLSYSYYLYYHMKIMSRIETIVF